MLERIADVVRAEGGTELFTSYELAKGVPGPFTRFRFPAEVIVLAMRWYLRYGLS